MTGVFFAFQNPHAPPPVEPSWSSSEDEGPRRPRESGCILILLGLAWLGFSLLGLA